MDLFPRRVEPALDPECPPDAAEGDPAPSAHPIEFAPSPLGYLGILNIYIYIYLQEYTNTSNKMDGLSKRNEKLEVPEEEEVDPRIQVITL